MAARTCNRIRRLDNKGPKCAFRATKASVVQGDYDSDPGIDCIGPQKLTHHDTVSDGHRDVRVTVGRLALQTPRQHFSPPATGKSSPKT